MDKLTPVTVHAGFKDMDKLEAIYSEAFPPAERKLTISQIVESTVFKQDVRAYYKDRDVVGFSVSTLLGEFNYFLFLAVSKDVRSCGYGGIILDSIIKECGDKPLIFSIEDPSEQCDNSEQRKRRESFYLRHGCVYMGMKNSSPEGGPTFCLMSSIALEDYTPIKETLERMRGKMAEILAEYAGSANPQN